MRAATFFLAAALLAGCREGVEPFRPSPPEDDGLGRRTFDVGHDLDPVWLADDTLVYASESFPGVPASPGLLLRLPLDGGAADAFFPDLQSPALGGPRWLAQPAVSPDGARIAYVQLARVVAPRPAAIGGAPCFVPEPQLDSIAIHVRAVDGSDSAAKPAVAGFRTAGRDPDQDAGEPGPYIQTVYPFHDLFVEQRLLAFHPAWSPDGGQLVFSDGLGLYIRSADGTVRPVPNTADGIGPAWDPTGEWIAFTRAERPDSVTYNCSVSAPPGATLHIRTGYPNVRPVLTLIHADGTGARVLGEGWDAAWSPDGASLFFRRDDRLWRIARAGGTAQPVADTERGRTPAIAPDGRRMALSRRSDLGDLDVWVVDLGR